jgi:hypothetical protein
MYASETVAEFCRRQGTSEQMAALPVVHGAARCGQVIGYGPSTREYAATAVIVWLRDQHVGCAFIAPGRLWHNGYLIDGDLQDSHSD